MGRHRWRRARGRAGWLYDERAAAGTLATAGFEADVSERCNGGLDVRTSTGVEGNTVHFEGDRTAILEVDTEGPGLRMRLVADEADGVVPWLGIVVGTTETEAFYGLGETFDGILHRGRVRPMQIEVEIERESGYNEVHVPVPLLVSSASWECWSTASGPVCSTSQQPDRTR